MPPASLSTLAVMKPGPRTAKTRMSRVLQRRQGVIAWFLFSGRENAWARLYQANPSFAVRTIPSGHVAVAEIGRVLTGRDCRVGGRGVRGWCRRCGRWPGYARDFLRRTG